MILYHSPSFSSKNFNYSLLSSSFFVLLGLYFVIFQKAPLVIQYVISMVGIFSVVHHLRNYDEEYNDIIRMFDIFFANLLAICVFYYRPTLATLLFGILLLSTFLSIQYWITSNKYKSLVHAVFHTSICIFLFLSFQKDLKILKNRK